MDSVWVFNGENSNFPSGVFSTREKAEAWISSHGLSGCLTLYPLDQGAYDWSIERGLFSPQNDHQESAGFIARFSGGSEHYHYDNGAC
ncbi:MAG: hypothetical protein ACE37H_06370 [Phycisphaeraceae bacterium]